MLLPESLLHLPTQRARYEAVKNIVKNAVEDGSFTYTDLLLSDEALYTTAFMALDGTVFDGAMVPQQGAHEVIQTGTIRLVSIDKNQPIKHSSWYQPRIPGTDKRGEPVKQSKDLGTDALVNDSLDGGRVARCLLLKYGWPNRNIMSRSGTVGTIVEWRWLERAALAAGNAPEDQEIRDLYETLKERIEPKSPAAPAQQTKRQNAPNQGAGVTP